MRLFIRGSYAVASDHAVFPVAVNKNIKDLVDNDGSIRDLLSLFHNELKRSNRIGSKISVDVLLKLFTTIYGTDILDFPLKDFFDFMLYVNPTLNEAVFNKFFMKDLLQLHKESMMILNRQKSINDISSKLKLLLEYMNEKIQKKPLINNTIPTIVKTFNDYYLVYDRLNDLWHSEGPLTFVGLLNFDESTFYDWFNERDARDDTINTVSIMLLMMGIAVILLADPYYVDAIGCTLLIFVLVFDVTLVSYVINVNEYFDTICKAEPDILLHVVHENENHQYIPITGLQGEFIKATNNDAVEVCNSKNNLGGWNRQYFTYTLGPSTYMESKTGEQGWYSLNERVYINDPYEQAPLPPGNWTIDVGGNNHWLLNSTTLKNINGREVIIIDPYIIEIQQ